VSRAKPSIIYGERPLSAGLAISKATAETEHQQKPLFGAASTVSTASTVGAQSNEVVKVVYGKS
jgi:hypothetical protein